jgi:hypothetical protein
MNPLALSNVIQFMCAGLLVIFFIADFLTENAYFVYWLLSGSGFIFSVAAWYGLWQGEKVGDYSWRI